MVKQFLSILCVVAASLTTTAIARDLQVSDAVVTLQPMEKVTKQSVAKAPVSAAMQKQMQIEQIKKSLNPELVQKLESKKNSVSASRADASTSIEGLWDFQLGDWYRQGGAGSIHAVYQASFDGDNLWFDYVSGAGPGKNFPFVATFDEATGTLTFTYSFVNQLNTQFSDGSTAIVDCYQQPYYYDYDESSTILINALTAKYDAGAGTIVFTPDQGLAWMAVQNGQSLGTYYVMDLEGAVRFNADADWENVGTCTVMDGWILSAYGVDHTSEAYWYDAPLQQKVSNPNVYRIVDPYKGNHPLYLAGLNKSTTTGYIEFDVTDPNHVVFNITPAGCSDSQPSEYYCNNYLGYFCAAYPSMTAQQIVSALGDDIPYTTLKDGVVELRSKWSDPNWNYDDDNDACFGIAGNENGGYGWTDSSRNSINMAAKIIMPKSGIGSIYADRDEFDANAPVEYFNLQGIKISNPEAGQVVIKRQGSKVSKEVVR